MGSLPNLNDLYREKAERRVREKERELARERAREREFSRDRDSCRDRDRLPIFVHQVQLPKYHHRHSLTSRRVLRTRSSGATYHVWDDPMIEHMAAYSPISSRSHRIGIAPYQIQTGTANRRRDSGNSSIGATSVRRLLTVNRGCRHKIPVHVRAKVIKNFILLVIAHGLTCAALVPIIGLQGSNSTWFEQKKWIHFGPDIGSILFSFSFLITSGMCLLTPRLIRRYGFFIVTVISYGGLCLFLTTHFFPSIYSLFPGYLILGITLGPAWIGKLAFVVSLANKLSCGQHECCNTTAIENMEEHRVPCSREENVRRLARWYHAAQDLGIIFGAVIASLILSCNSRNPLDCGYMNVTSATLPSPLSFNITETGELISTETSSTMALAASTINYPHQQTTNETNSFAKRSDYEVIFSEFDKFNSYPSGDNNVIDGLFDINEHGERICGADSCPVWLRANQFNITNDSFTLNSHFGILPITGVFLGLCLIALGLSIASGKIDNNWRNEPIRGLTDTLLFAGPMAYFIGTEQGYILADFMKAFVSCSLGPHMVAGALVGMGIMQFIASCTLSMLLRHTKRIVVIVAGFFFHACLLLVLSRWKPSKDDSALFYVIAAAWGVCNAVWETLCFALISLTHTNNMLEITSPLQGLRFLGLAVTFAAHGFLCENPKILILAILLVICVPPYAMLEMKLEAQRKSHLPIL